MCGIELLNKQSEHLYNNYRIVYTLMLV